MPIDRLEFHDLMDERSRPALERPIPWQSLRARIRRSRRRRRAVAALAGAVTASLVISATVLSLRGPGQSDPTSVSIADPFPARYSEPDGTVYRKVAEATLDPASTKVTFDVDVRGKPLAIRADCPTKAWQPWVTVRVPGTSKKYRLEPPFLDCHDNRAVDVLPLPQGTRRATVTIEAHKKARPERWRFGVYEWTPPATMKAPPPPPEPAAAIAGWPLLATESSTWPVTGEVTLTVPNTGRQLALVTYCGGDLIRRLEQEIRVNSRPINTKPGCTAASLQTDPGATQAGPKVAYIRLDSGQRTTTIQVRLVTKIPQYRHRPGTLTAAVYEIPQGQ
ncbi:MAG TPA: hypothetical protein VFV66_31180 [Nonomuraea sp.]|nr:hypothetical protein [Nonomuraea sp.]